MLTTMSMLNTIRLTVDTDANRRQTQVWRG